MARAQVAEGQSPQAPLPGVQALLAILIKVTLQVQAEGSRMGAGEGPVQDAPTAVRADSREHPGVVVDAVVDLQLPLPSTPSMRAGAGTAASLLRQQLLQLFQHFKNLKVAENKKFSTLMTSQLDPHTVSKIVPRSR